MIAKDGVKEMSVFTLVMGQNVLAKLDSPLDNNQISTWTPKTRVITKFTCLWIKHYPLSHFYFAPMTCGTVMPGKGPLLQRFIDQQVAVTCLNTQKGRSLRE